MGDPHVCVGRLGPSQRVGGQSGFEFWASASVGFRV